MEKTILNISIDDNNIVTTNMPEKELAVQVISDIISSSQMEGRMDLLNTLFAITVHVLARESSGRFQKEYIENLESTIPQYRDAYRKAFDEERLNRS